MTMPITNTYPASLPMPGVGDAERWLYLDEAAVELRVSTKSIRRWAAAGRINARYIGTSRIAVDIHSASRPLHRMISPRGGAQL